MWLERVLPRPREDCRSQFRSSRAALESGAFDSGASRFARAGGVSVGLSVITAAEGTAHVEIVAVCESARRRGLGRLLLDSAIAQLRERRFHSLGARSVSSANAGAVRLLESMGFAGTSQGSLRMKRALCGPLPSLAAPAGYDLRCLGPGEEGEWVRLKNDCFPEDRAWTLDDFEVEYARAPCFDLSRIFVAAAAGRLVGTTTAWETDLGEGRVGLIHWVGVHPSHRGRGLARALSALALAELSARGYGEAWLNTSRDRVAAVGLYQSLGFAVHRELYTYRLALQ